MIELARNEILGFNNEKHAFQNRTDKLRLRGYYVCFHRLDLFH